ncbi:hypothetical protein [Cellulomonas sp.]|uniref:hypothetical protein n=1 Tax=Cellulomonas sp. TaxID=40001 RepID=UPI003BA92245
MLVGEDELIAFRHALLAEAVYTDLLPGEQSSLHRAYLRVLRDDPALGPSSQLASHALRAPDLPTALRASLDAADQAREVLAPGEELRHLEVALRLWDAVPEVTATLGTDHIDVLVAAAAAASRAGQVDRSVQLARAAVEETASDVPRQANLRTGLARYLLGMESVHDALEQSSRALADLPDAPTPERAWALATYARSALNADLDDEAVASATRAVELAREAGAADAESDALTTLAVLVVDRRGPRGRAADQRARPGLGRRATTRPSCAPCTTWRATGTTRGTCRAPRRSRPTGWSAPGRSA